MNALSPIGIIAFVLYLVLLVYFFTMWGRFAFDLVQSMSRGWRPKGPLLLLAEYTYTVTDPPIKFFRRLIPPLRIGPVALDFGWSITMLLVIVAMYIVGRIG
ncbi:MAG: YggT family protein [Naasia sp.]